MSYTYELINWAVSALNRHPYTKGKKKYINIYTAADNLLTLGPMQMYYNY